MGFWNKEEPLGLPKGSVRAIIVLLPLLAVVAAMLVGLVEVPDDMWDLLRMAFAFYFATRAAQAANGK